MQLDENGYVAGLRSDAPNGLCGRGAFDYAAGSNVRFIIRL